MNRRRVERAERASPALDDRYADGKAVKEQPGRPANTSAPGTGSVAGEAREKVGEALGMSGKSYERAMVVVTAAEAGKPLAVPRIAAPAAYRCCVTTTDRPSSRTVGTTREQTRMTATPEPILLPSGDILVPEKDQRGTWRMAQIGPDSSAYAGWLAHVQTTERTRMVGTINRGLWRFTWQLALLLLVLAVLALSVIVAAFRSALNSTTTTTVTVPSPATTR